ncbi:ribonuclease R [Geomonas sp. RF6]|uniref:ribonuclease R n=1 Tax=Geomonas sp. RF6 TaxID=2897342 RepID=UPI001E631217|nr:ribonuclease R [Geomonas sp. RF6]UFS69700.1 ribonuclease R [Geomonas sp. RF6]
MRIDKNVVLKLLKGRRDALQFREILKVLAVPKHQRPRLESLLDDMVYRGDVVRLPGRLYSLAGAGGTVRGKLVCHREGYGFVVPEDGGDDLFIPARYLRDSLSGDTVEAQVVSTRRDGKREGRVTALVKRGVTSVVGRYEAAGRGGRVIPDDDRLGRDVFIPPGAAGNALTGETVVAEIVSYPTPHSGMSGKIVEVLGHPSDPEVEVMTVVRKFELPYAFSDGALAEAAKAPQRVSEDMLAGRTDLRERRTVTIDGETARDFDDAVSVVREGSGLRLFVSIADVSHYVTEGSKLDLDAYQRGTSVYFPDRCIPMLPEELSNGICSLNPQVDRLTMTAEILFDEGGAPVSSSFYPSVIRSDARLTYTIVKRIVVDEEPEAIAAHEDLVADLNLMKELALKLNGRRQGRGSIDFDLPEPQIIIDLQGETTAIVRAERNFAHRIIEEFMLAANEAVATFIERQGSPSLYRVHENPDPAKLVDLAEFVFSFGYTLKVEEEKVAPKELQRLLSEVEGKPEERLINEVLLRCMKQARYSAENLGHFGLAAPCYTHFTSPIRRYPDLVVHRILRRLLSAPLKEGERTRLAGRLDDVALHTSRRERIAMEAEREMVDLKKMQFMRDKVGEEYEGFITGVAPFGIFVELVDLFVEGMVPVTTLPVDYYLHMEKSHALVGQHSRVMYRIADKVRVRVAGVRELARQVEFALVETLEERGAVSRTVSESYPRVAIKGKRPKSRRR